MTVLNNFSNTDDDRAINERSFIRKIDESKAEIRQLENNLLFFNNASEDNPMVKDVRKNIAKQKEALDTWKEIEKLNILENSRNKTEESPAEMKPKPPKNRIPLAYQTNKKALFFFNIRPIIRLSYLATLTDLVSLITVTLT